KHPHKGLGYAQASVRRGVQIDQHSLAWCEFRLAKNLDGRVARHAAALFQDKFSFLEAAFEHSVPLDLYIRPDHLVLFIPCAEDAPDTSGQDQASIDRPFVV